MAKTISINMGVTVNPQTNSVKVRYMHQSVARGKNVSEWVDAPKRIQKQVFEAMVCEFARRF